MAESDLVPVRVLTSEVEAEIAKGALEAFGIDCMISHDNCGGQRPHLSFGGGIRLLVRAGDLERAEEVLTGSTEDTV